MPRGKGSRLQEYTRKYEQAFLEDMGTLNLERPGKDCSCHGAHCPRWRNSSRSSADERFAYGRKMARYYFSIAKFPEYGKLSKKDFGGMEAGAAWTSTRYEKDNARDFALWKAPKPGEAFWESVIGPGRPAGTLNAP